MKLAVILGVLLLVIITEVNSDRFIECLRRAKQCNNVRRWEMYRFCKVRMHRQRREIRTQLHGHVKLRREKRRFTQLCGELPVRKEIREYTPSEWRAFTNALNKLKQRGIYDELVAIHRGNVTHGAHRGPAFLGWHRIYIYMLEWHLRNIDPCVSIPYWDSSLDFEMDEPTDSLLFTDKYLGNGDGRVSTGPFANWKTSQGQPLMRDIGVNGSLISKEFIEKVLSRKLHSDITNLRNRQYSLEGYHNGPHVWVNGQMALLDEASEDPLFWMHHAFIDCIWQKFIEKNDDGNPNYPMNDYPINAEGLHEPDRKMDPFEWYTNRDGYSPMWYDLYNCKPFPNCSALNPKCPSDDLYCDEKKWKCVAKGTASKMAQIPSSLALPLGETFKATVQDKRDKGVPIPQRDIKLPPSPNFKQAVDTAFQTKEQLDTTSHDSFSCQDLKDFALSFRRRFW